jgi:hypothetical protein
MPGCRLADPKDAAASVVIDVRLIRNNDVLAWTPAILISRGPRSLERCGNVRVSDDVGCRWVRHECCSDRYENCDTHLHFLLTVGLSANQRCHGIESRTSIIARNQDPQHCRRSDELALAWLNSGQAERKDAPGEPDASSPRLPGQPRVTSCGNGIVRSRVRVAR